MIKSVIKLALILVVGIVSYNYFLGDEQEKAQAKQIVKGTGKAIKQGVGLLKGEYQKFKDGKYDRALDKVGNLLKDAKEKGGSIVEDIKDWEEKKEIWKEKKEELMEYIENNPDEDEAVVKEKLKELEKESKALEKAGKELKKKADEN